MKFHRRTHSGMISLNHSCCGRPLGVDCAGVPRDQATTKCDATVYTDDIIGANSFRGLGRLPVGQSTDRPTGLRSRIELANRICMEQVVTTLGESPSLRPVHPLSRRISVPLVRGAYFRRTTRRFVFPRWDPRRNCGKFEAHIGICWYTRWSYTRTRY